MSLTAHHCRIRLVKACWSRPGNFHFSRPTQKRKATCSTGSSTASVPDVYPSGTFPSCFQLKPPKPVDCVVVAACGLALWKLSCLPPTGAHKPCSSAIPSNTTCRTEFLGCGWLIGTRWEGCYHVGLRAKKSLTPHAELSSLAVVG